MLEVEEMIKVEAQCNNRGAVDQQEYDGQTEVYVVRAWKQKLDEIWEKTTMKVARRVKSGVGGSRFEV